jgi:hypothetical protein
VPPINDIERKVFKEQTLPMVVEEERPLSAFGQSVNDYNDSKNCSQCNYQFTSFDYEKYPQSNFPSQSRETCSCSTTMRSPHDNS